MKKEYLFFLVMVLAAAVITGATVGFISNFHYIEKQVKENSNQLKPTQPQVSVLNSDDQSNGVKNKTTNPEDKGNQITDNQINKVAVVRSATPVADQGYLVLSKEEKQQVVDMLDSLGANKDGDYITFIRNFQIEKSLPPTGNLDSLTLNAIINEATRQRAAQTAKG